MEKIFLIGAIVMLMAGENLFAQGKAGLPPVSEGEAERMKTELALSDEQFTRLKKLNEEFREKNMWLRSDTSLTRANVMAERRHMLENREKELRDILTKDQYEKWVSMKAGLPANSGRDQRLPMDSIRQQELKKELAINDDQIARVVAIDAEMARLFQRLGSDTTVTRENRGTAIREIFDERAAKIKKVLTQEQYARFVEFEKRKAKERRRSGRRLGAGGPRR